MCKIFNAFTATLLIMLAGCGPDADDSSSVSSLQEQQKTEEQKTEKPRVILKGTELTYNGKPVKLGTSLDEWLPVIGVQQADRIEVDSSTGGRMIVFEKIGIVLLATPEGDNPKIIAIQFVLREWPANISPLNDASKTSWKGFNAVSSFKGYLEVDGVEIHQYSIGSTVSEINRSLSKAHSGYSLKCDREANMCLDILMVDGYSVAIGVSVDVDSDGSIYMFGIGLGDE